MLNIVAIGEEDAIWDGRDKSIRRKSCIREISPTLRLGESQATMPPKGLWAVTYVVDTSQHLFQQTHIQRFQSCNVKRAPGLRPRRDMKKG